MSWRTGWLVGAAALLSACASTWVVSSDVQTFSQLTTLPAPATYRFERLPSQQAVPAEQAVLEAAAEPALAKAGLVRQDASPRYSVQVGTTLLSASYVDPWGPRFGWGPWGGFGAHGFYGARWHGRRGYYAPGPAWGWRADYYWDSPSFQREVSLVIRDAATQQVVYETRAAHMARWPNDPALLTPMFDAALSSFPQPPAGVRRVNVEVPNRK